MSVNSPANLPFHILIAEDDDDDRILIKDAFSAAGIPVNITFFKDGQKLISYLDDKRNKEITPSAIVLDLNMPVMSGKEALQFIKDMHNFNKIPVFVFSTSRDSFDIESTFALGAFRYIVKPTSFYTLINLMKKLKQSISEPQIIKPEVIDDFILTDEELRTI